MLAEHMKGGSRDDDALVFTAPGGGPLRYANFRRRVWVEALDRLAARKKHMPAGLTVHHLRHTAASMLIRQQGASIKAVQEQLGHSSPTVTLNVYTHLFEDDLDRLFAGIDAARPAPVVDQKWTSGDAEVVSLAARTGESSG